MSAPEEGAVAKLELLFHRYQAIAVEWATRHYGSRGLAEDAVQEAFMQLFIKAAAGDHAILDGGGSVVIQGAQWAASKMIERARATAAREQRYAAVGLDEDDEWVRAETRTLIDSLCNRLSNEHREALRLHYVAGYPDEASARLLGISTKAFQSRRRRALEAARDVAAPGGRPVSSR